MRLATELKRFRVPGAIRAVLCAVVLHLMLCGIAGAATYYVDGSSPTCSNTGPGTLATPYCTISAALAARGTAGNTILVKPGVYREQVTLPASGTAGSPIALRALGDVTIDGADDLSGTSRWTPLSGNVWLASSVTWSPKQVFSDGTKLTASTAQPGNLPTNTYRWVSGAGLYLNVGGGNPGLHTLLVGRRTNGFNLTGRSYVTIQGFTVVRSEDRGITFTNAATADSVIGCTVRWAGYYGIYATGCTNLTIIGCVTSDNANHGIGLTGGTSGCSIVGNESYRNAFPTARQANGLYLYGATNNRIERNRWHHNQDTGQHMQSGADNNLSIQNLSYANGDHGYDHLGARNNVHIGDVAYGNFMDGYSIEGSSTGNVLTDCVAVDNGEYDLWVDAASLSGFISDYNLFWNASPAPPVKVGSTVYASVGAYAQATRRDAHSTQADPRFLDSEAGLFQPLAGSPLIDSGASDHPSWPPLDAAGQARADDPATANTGAGPVPFADRGAFEYVPPPVPPVASLTVTPASGTAPLAVVANASGSSDGDGQVVAYRFDFGDGTLVGPQASPTASHTYAAGQWTASVTVTDNSGLTATTTAPVAVNAPPVAVLALDRTAGKAPLGVTAGGTGSSDPDGVIAAYTFDFGDGTVVGPQSAPTTTHAFGTGTWNVTLTVRDDHGATTTTAPQTVTVANPNVPPTAALAVTPASGMVPLAVQADATGSSDSDGGVVSYRFDFGDGTIVGPQAGPTASHVYTTAGPYSASVRVTDTDGGTGTATVAVTASSPVPADEVHWTFAGATAVTLDWRGPDSQIRYGTTTAYGLTANGQTPSPLPFSSSGPFWEAKLAGLQPNTTYHYSIGGGEDHVFHTPPAAGASDFTVCVIADVGDATTYPRVAGVQSLIAAAAPDFVLAPGDLTYGDDDLARVDRHFNDVMTWSRDAAYMPAWGNHEWEGLDDLRNYKGRFDLPNPQASPNAPSAGCCGEDWYWFDYGNARFIAYPEPYSGAWANWLPQAKVLMDQAQADANLDFIVTFGHRPAYSSGHHAGDAFLKSCLDTLGSRHSKYVLNLNGHSHDYERTYPQQGVTHITAGGGGSTLEEESGACLWAGGCPPPAFSAFRAFHHGMVKLHFTQSGIELTSVCGPAGDSGANFNDVTCTVGSAMDAAWIPAGNMAPNAAIDEPTGPITLVEGGSVSFAATGGDPDGDLPLAWAWSFGGGAPDQTVEDPGPVTFATPGTYTVTLTVTDARGKSDPTPDTRVITVLPANQAPNGTIDAPAADLTIPVGSALTFAGTAGDPDGNLPLAYAWSFGGAAPDQAVEDPGVVTFSTPGTWTVTFTVTDALGLADPTPATRVVTVSANQFPNAVIDAPAADVVIPVDGSVTFAATGSDPDGHLPLTYAWSFGGGAPGQAVEDPGPVMFTTPGVYTVTVTVTDALGLVDPTPATRQVTVTENQAPDGAIDQPAADLTIPRGGSVTFAGAGTDPDNHLPLTYAWSFGGGAPDQALEDPGVVTFPNAGVYSVTFTVTDALGLADPTPATRVITVTAPNQPPTAVVSASPLTGNAPLTVTASGVGSSDPDGSIVSWRFDFGDGTVIGPQGSATASHVYTTGGTFTLSLVVTDNAGGVASAATTVIVAAPAGGTNLCGNPSFETGTTGWSSFSGASLATVAGGFDGNRALEIRGPISGTAAFGVNDSPNWTNNTTAGVRYRFSAWVRSVASTGLAKLQLREYLNNVKVGNTQFSSAVPLSPTWQLVSGDFVAQSTGSSLDLQVLDYPVVPGETFLVDNLSIRVVTGGAAPARALPESAPGLAAGLADVRVEPNPIRGGGAMLRLTAGRPGTVSIEILDLRGRRVRARAQELWLPAGQVEFPLDARGDGGAPLAAGVYFFRIRGAGAEAHGRFVVMR